MENPFPWDTPAALPTPDAVDPTGKLPSWLDIGVAESELAKFEDEIIKRESESEIALPSPEQPSTDGIAAAPMPPPESALAPEALAETPLPDDFLNLDDLPLPPEFVAPQGLPDVSETPIPQVQLPPLSGEPTLETIAAPPDMPQLPAPPEPASVDFSPMAPAPVCESSPEIAGLDTTVPIEGAVSETVADPAIEVPPWQMPAELASPAAPGTAEAAAETVPAAPPLFTPAEESAHILDEMVAAIDATIAPEEESALTLAPAARKPQVRTAEEQLVVFTLGGVDYGVAIANLREVGRLPSVTPVPNVPTWVLGVANIRGDVVSLVDLRAFLGLEPFGRQTSARMLVARDRQEEVTAGLVVDQVKGIRYVTADRINPATSPIEDRVAPYLRGFTEQDGRLLVLLDLNRLLLSPEMRQFEPI